MENFQWNGSLCDGKDVEIYIWFDFFVDCGLADIESQKLLDWIQLIRINIGKKLEKFQRNRSNNF